MNPIFYGVGVGPGDPELLTLKALRMMREADILAVPGRDRDSSLAYRIALGADRSLADKECLCIPMPMTKDANKLDESHAAGAQRICEQLAAGKNVAFLTLGDPTVYSTYLYLQKRVKQAGYRTQIISGIASFLAAAAAFDIGLVEQRDQLHIIPSTYGVEQALELSGTKVLMKAGKQMAAVKAAVLQTADDIYMIENCGMENERMIYGAQELPDDAGYYSLIIVKENS